MYTRRHKSGASLFELVAAIAVATVLIAIVVVSSRTALTRTRMSRVLEEHRQIRAALDKYHLENGTLPTTAQGLAALVAPTPYLSKLPIDPFDRTGTNAYIYVAPDPREGLYLLASRGPDGDVDVPPELLVAAGAATESSPPAAVARIAPGDPADSPTGAGKSPADAVAAGQHPSEEPPPSGQILTLMGEYQKDHSYTPGASSSDGDIITLSR